VCDDTSLKGACVDTTLGGSGGGAVGASPIYPTQTALGVVEQALYDSVSAEPARLSGTPVRLFSVRRAKNRHPLYAEPSFAGKEWEFHGPWELMGAFEFDQGMEIDQEATSEGLHEFANAALYLSRKELENVEAPEPKIGDIIWLWDRKPFAEEGGDYWDVTKANRDGNIWTTEVFVQYRLELRWRSKFDPARKIEGTRT